MRVLLTGAAGFIGFHCCRKLLESGYHVVGVDNLNDYYDVSLKKSRLKILESDTKFTFLFGDISKQSILEDLITEAGDVDAIIHLAAQAGVRYSLENPYTYVDVNVTGQLVLLEFARSLKGQIKNFIFASTSSVYGSNTKLPFSVEDRTDTPLAAYAVTKKCGELMAHAYSHLYQIPINVLRFFTVYGPWGRPDMAAFLFTRAMLAGEPIKVFNHGNMRRNFSYVGDVVEGIFGALKAPASGDLPYRIYNIGNNKSESLIDFITMLQDKIGIEAKMDMRPLQPGDVKETVADITSSERDLNFSPKTQLREGLGNFVDWYREYYNV